MLQTKISDILFFPVFLKKIRKQILEKMLTNSFKKILINSYKVHLVFEKYGLKHRQLIFKQAEYHISSMMNSKKSDILLFPFLRKKFVRKNPKKYL